MIMQSYDFYYLFQHYGCNMQFGGDDQWSNMLGGTELIRRKLGKDAHAMTITLLMNSEGKKMGKTAKGAVWLDPNKTTPFEFYQYWRNVGRRRRLKCIRMLTFLPLEQIDEMDKLGRQPAQPAPRRSSPMSSPSWSTAKKRQTRRKPRPRRSSRAAATTPTCRPPSSRKTSSPMARSPFLNLMLACQLIPSKGEGPPA